MHNQTVLKVSIVFYHSTFVVVVEHTFVLAAVSRMFGFFFASISGEQINLQISQTHNPKRRLFSFHFENTVFV